jgi:hypothetical protein
MIFESENDWSQFLQGLILSIAILFSGGKIIATLLSIFSLLLGCYYAFGKKIIFYDSYFYFKTFFSKGRIEIKDIAYIEFNSGFLGKSFFTIFLKNEKKMKAYCSGDNRLVLKKIIELKNIKLTSKWSEL